jgi:predicted RNase H-like HicB family nuclease
VWRSLSLAHAEPKGSFVDVPLILHTMERQYPYTAYYVEGDEGWIVAFAAEFPAIIAQGRTIEEAREDLRDAVKAIIAANIASTRERIEDRRILLVQPEMTGRPA